MSRAQWGRDTKRFHMIVEDGDSLGETYLDEILVPARYPTPKEMAAARKAIEEFTRLRWNVHKVYPYARKVASVQAQVTHEMANLPPHVSKKEYVKAKEKALFAKYEPDIRRMTRDQGRVLIKLIHREAHTTMYELVKEDKNTVSAVFWQGVGSLFSIDLKAEYNPKEDYLIDAIVKELEGGGYNMVYKTYNYELP